MKSIPQNAPLPSGIYSITHIGSNRKYVGSSSNISRRLRTHKYHLRNNKHPNKHLQNCWNLYGEGEFSFDIIEKTAIALLEEREEYWIQSLGASNRVGGFNVRLEAGTNRGYVPSEELRQRLSKANTGRKHTMETRERVRKATIGHDVSLEVRQIISNKLKGRKLHPETVAKMKMRSTGKMTQEEIQYIFEQIAIRRAVSDVAEELRVADSTVIRIIRRKMYGRYEIKRTLVEQANANIGIATRKGFNHACTKLSPSDIEEAKEMLQKGCKQKDIALHFNIDSSVISRINTGKHHSSSSEIP